MKGLLFTYALTYGGAVASLFRPYWGLLIYVCFAIIRPESMWRWSVAPGNYSRIVALALLAGWVLHGLGDWRLGKAWPVLLALLGYWLWMVVSASRAPNSFVAWSYVEIQSKIFLPFLVGITLIKSVEQIRQLAWVVVLSQGYVAFEANLSYLQEGWRFIKRFREDGFAGLDNNNLSVAMVIGVSVALFLALSSNKRWQKGLLAVLALLMAHVVLLAMSRGGMIGLIATGVVTLLLIPRKPVYYLTTVGIVALVLFMAGPQVRERFNSSFKGDADRDASAESRLDLWHDCLDLASRDPVFGAGPDHWVVYAESYGWPPGKAAHTFWLKILAELGVPGLSCLVLFYGQCTIRLWAYASGPDVPGSERAQLRWLGRMVIAGLIGYAVTAQFLAIDRLELPYYVALIGAAVLKVGLIVEFGPQGGPAAQEAAEAESAAPTAVAAPT